MRKMVSLLILGFLAGCGSAEPAGAPVVTPASPTPTVWRATVDQYANLVRTPMTNIRSAWRTFQADDCATSGSLPCRLTASSLELDAQSLFVSLEEEPFGAPPVELEQLVADTVSAAKAVDENIDVEGNVEPTRLPIAMADLLGNFERWEPYF